MMISNTRSRWDVATLLAPRSIAVLGASPNVDRHTGRTVANLQRTGYTGRILPVNPRHSSVFGLECVPSVAALAEVPDAAYVLVRADTVLDRVAECAEAGVRSIVVCTSGFAEEGEAGGRIQAQLAAVARAHGARVLGPNCIGVVNITDAVVAAPTFNLSYRMLPGALTVVSQSGGMAVNILNRAQGRGIGVRAAISVGNECDLDVADLVGHLALDDETSVVALFLEQVRHVDHFAESVAAARSAGKEVLALKVGASEAGARSSRSHTGAMTGSAEVFRGVMEQLGVRVATSVDELLGAGRILAEPRRPAGRRVLVVSPSGGECSYVADAASRAGLDLPDLDEAARDRLAQVMRFGAPGNPLDLTGQVIGDAELLASVIEILEKDDGFDSILYALATWGSHDADRLLPVIVNGARASRRCSAVSAWAATGVTERAEEILAASGLPVFGDADTAVASLALASRQLPSPVQPTDVADLRRPVSVGDEPNEFEAKAFLAGCGLPVSLEYVVASADQAVQKSDLIGYPVVLKQLCRSVAHKSDLGLVRVDVRDADEVRRTMVVFDETVRRHALVPDGVIVAQQAEGAEVIVGGIRDEQFGPLVMVGAGGVLAELLDDKVFARCPVSVDEATSMLGRLRTAALLDGFRGRPRDVVALAELVSRFSAVFAGAQWLQEADLNPVVVHSVGEGVTIVDAWLAVGGPV